MSSRSDFDKREVVARGQGLSLPGKPHPVKVYAKASLPCYVILVHGVNDLGESYPQQ